MKGPFFERRFLFMLLSPRPIALKQRAVAVAQQGQEVTLSQLSKPPYSIVEGLKGSLLSSFFYSDVQNCFHEVVRASSYFHTSHSTLKREISSHRLWHPAAMLSAKYQTHSTLQNFIYPTFTFSFEVGEWAASPVVQMMGESFLQIP